MCFYHIFRPLYPIHILRAIIILSLLLCMNTRLQARSAAAGISVNDDPVTIAVIPMEFRGDRRWSRIDVGEQVSALITDRLVEKGVKFQVVEREHLSSILAEQNLVRGGRVDPSRAVEIGRLLGAQMLVFGTVTRFELSSTGRVGVGGIGVGGTRGRVSLTNRVVDATSGVILGSVEGNGSGTGASIDVADLRGVSFSASEFMESAIGRATVEAVDEVSDKLASIVNKNADELRGAEFQEPTSGLVVDLLDNGAIINLGADDGIRVEQRLDVSRLRTVGGLEERIRVPIGTIRIVSVQRSAAVGVFENGGGSSVEIGDVVTVR
jgi:curli biogenesis system outer membrane secretion channel CsgG